MNDKVILTKKKKKLRVAREPRYFFQRFQRSCKSKMCGEKKGKLNIFCAISAIFLTFNMFFVYLYFQQGLCGIVQKKENIYCIYLFASRHNQNDHHKWIQKIKFILVRSETDFVHSFTYIYLYKISRS
jgi:hypothetical protein